MLPHVAVYYCMLLYVTVYCGMLLYVAAYYCKLLYVTVCYCLTERISFDVRAVFTLLPKVQLHVSAINHSHLQVVHESLERSYTRFNMGCVRWGCGR